MNAHPVPAIEPGEVYVAVNPPTSHVFPALVDHHRANGFAQPRFRPAVLEAITAWVNSTNTAGDPSPASGMQILAGLLDLGYNTTPTVSVPDDMAALVEALDVVAPDTHGRYPLGAGTVEWTITAPMDEPDPLEALRAETDRLTPLAGEGIVTISARGNDPLFPALIDSERWNGFASPRFRRPVAEVVVAWLNTTYRASPDGSYCGYWDEDVIVLVDPQAVDVDGYVPERIEPDPEGYYVLGAWEWAWELVSAPSAR
ncbi:hypothetical protein N8J89_03785 [Crossiella sp. CA-258035]|uniref:hypothetical protein n=1 Tax=Crossiella sp. CA-258035 TaxID=2981138 RepID=UPI0024BC895A|nr:hypothetical protein [Crossiella sp. CA-258035]WHT20205.1 hypothetical protein N8J89_03785 [Crossiella sp. CA-258035]